MDYSTDENIIATRTRHSPSEKSVDQRKIESTMANMEAQTTSPPGKMYSAVVKVIKPSGMLITPKFPMKASKVEISEPVP